MTELNEAVRAVPMPDRIKKLPVSEKGFPIPEFVAWLDAERKGYLPRGTHGAIRDFRVIDPDYLHFCFRLSRCWVCAEPLGRHRVFAIGSMCLINKNTMEPPSHRDCAEYAARTCPFMVSPRMRRNPTGDIVERYSSIPGEHLTRNPGVYCLYETETYKRYRVDKGMLCRLGEPTRVDWWSAGRPATREEVVASIDSGMPFLMDMAALEGADAVKELMALRTAAERYFPRA